MCQSMSIFALLFLFFFFFLSTDTSIQLMSAFLFFSIFILLCYIGVVVAGAGAEYRLLFNVLFFIITITRFFFPWWYPPLAFPFAHRTLHLHYFIVDIEHNIHFIMNGSNCLFALRYIQVEVRGCNNNNN